MAKVNKPVIIPKELTHGGAVAARITDIQALRRSVLSTFLWENNFYEDGVEIATRVKELCHKVSPYDLSQLAIQAREGYKLRHMPLYLSRELVRHPALAKEHTENRGIVADTIERVVQRADELCEFLALYWKDKKVPIAAQVKKGLARAFCKFDGYALAKYNRDNAIKLKDVLFLTHAKPKDAVQADLWKKLIDNTLPVPETWEVLISACGSDKAKKKVAFEKLLAERKMGALAILRNLRNFKENGVDEKLVINAINTMKTERVLPFRFIEAVKYAPQWEQYLEGAMLKCLEGCTKLSGKTILIFDASGSMASSLSSKSNLSRYDAAVALSILAREIFPDIRIYATAGSDMARTHATTIVPARRGFGLGDAIRATNKKIGGGGIFLKQVMDYVKAEEGDAERIIVLTDEQDCDDKCNPSTANAFGEKNYLINIAAHKNGIGYGKWHHIDGFSEATLDYIVAFENTCLQ